LDWTSLSQVKEVGIHVTQCPCLANDIAKIFEVYRYLGKDLDSDLSQFHGWPQSMLSYKNEKSRFFVDNSNAFFSTSPKLIGSPSRTNDLDALLHVMRNATKTISVEVMSYMPLAQYAAKKSYWDEIEYEIKSAILRYE
jgi:phospholipase D3/4